MQIGWLQTFVAVHRTGSFTKAAQCLGLSQPTVTHQMNNLERAFGRSLFERTRYGAQPTPAAEDLIRQVAPSIDELNAVINRNPTGDLPSPVLSLGGPPDLIALRVLPELTELIRNGRRFTMSYGSDEDLLTRLSDGRLDLAIVSIRPKDRAIDSHPLFDEEHVLVASPNIAARIDTQCDISSAASGYPLLAIADSVPMIENYWDTVFPGQQAPTPTTLIPDMRGLVTAVAAGAGIAVLPTYLCTSDLQTGALSKVADPDTPPLRTFYLAERAGTLSQPHIATLNQHLLRQARTWT